jgi:hypothetical protein
MDSLKRRARYAGLLYFLMGVIAPIGLMYVPGKLILPGDPATTADRIRESPALLRLGIGSELVHQIIAIFLVLALYDLFRGVSEKRARLMVILSLLGIPIVLLNVVNEIAALILVRGDAFLSVIDQEQLDALAFFFLRLHGRGLDVASIFWGLWLFPFGILVIRSGFIPKFLGYLLFVAGFAYLASAFATLVVPELLPVVSRFALPLEAAEVPIILWLLIFGAKTQRPTNGT